MTSIVFCVFRFVQQFYELHYSFISVAPLHCFLCFPQLHPCTEKCYWCLSDLCVFCNDNSAGGHFCSGYVYMPPYPAVYPICTNPVGNVTCELWNSFHCVYIFKLFDYCLWSINFNRCGKRKSVCHFQDFKDFCLICGKRKPLGYDAVAESEIYAARHNNRRYKKMNTGDSVMHVFDKHGQIVGGGMSAPRLPPAVPWGGKCLTKLPRASWSLNYDFIQENSYHWCLDNRETNESSERDNVPSSIFCRVSDVYLYAFHHWAWPCICFFVAIVTLMLRVQVQITVRWLWQHNHMESWITFVHHSTFPEK